MPETVVSPVEDSGSKSVKMAVSRAVVRSRLEHGARRIHHLLLKVPSSSQVYARPYISNLERNNLCYVLVMVL